MCPGCYYPHDLQTLYSNSLTGTCRQIPILHLLTCRRFCTQGAGIGARVRQRQPLGEEGTNRTCGNPITFVRDFRTYIRFENGIKKCIYFFDFEERVFFFLVDIFFERTADRLNYIDCIKVLYAYIYIFLIGRGLVTCVSEP